MSRQRISIAGLQLALVGLAVPFSAPPLVVHAFTAARPSASTCTVRNACQRSAAFGCAAPPPRSSQRRTGARRRGLAAAAAADEADDRAKTLRVIMDHIADLEDEVERKQSSGAGAASAKKKSETNSKKSQIAEASSSSTTRTSKSAEASSSPSGDNRSVNPLKALARWAPTDGMNRLVFVLAFMTGVADVAMVLKYKNFATMMTGNTMWMASHALNGLVGPFLYLSAVLGSYMAGLAVFRRTYQRLSEQSLQLFAPMITAAFLAADHLTYADPVAKLVPMCLLSGAYGIINAVGTDMAGTMCFVLTGHLTRITNALVDRFSTLAGKKPLDAAGMLRSSSVFLGFFLGAAAAWGGVQVWPSLQDRGLLSLMGTVYGALFLWQDAKNMGGWWHRKSKSPECEIDNYDANCV